MTIDTVRTIRTPGITEGGKIVNLRLSESEISVITVADTTRSSSERQSKYRKTPKGRATERRYRHSNSRWQTHRDYLSRVFCPIDGEGYTVNGRHLYTLLASKDGGNYTSVANPFGLSSRVIFDYLLTLADTDSIKVVYGGSYDFNMWLTDLPEEALRTLYDKGRVVWSGYRLTWQRGKAFRIAPYPKGKSVTVYDVVSFFQRSFVEACDDYLGEWAGREFIVRNKAKRSHFTADDTAEIERYNELELDTLIDLMNELRVRLDKVGLRPRRWDGPGAIAAALLMRESVKDKRGPVPEDVSDAAQYAYAGGRFEPILYGAVEGPAYQYDINSAYPSAIRYLPDLSRGYWQNDTSDEYAAFALYHIEYVGKYADYPGPLFRRDRKGNVCYPMAVTGWYWSPEYAAAKRYCSAGYGTMRVIERKVFYSTSSAKPFEFVERLYLKRKALKKAGDGAHVGLKLALNSIYGKLCQQIGWRVENGELRLPPYHCLEWAGYITSHCRAQILDAILCDPESIIAIETDAVFSTRPLPLKVGDGLGEWEAKEYSKLTYVQSGLYFTDGAKGKAKTRGVDKGNLTESDVTVIMFSGEPYVTVTLNRFVTLGVGLTQDMARWRQWEQQEKTLTLHPTGKRIHNPMCLCKNGPGYWHTTICPLLSNEHSMRFQLEWVFANPDMEEMRRDETLWQD